MSKIKFVYVVGDKRFVVSLEEHMALASGITPETRIVKLRGGLVQLNVAFLQYAEVLEESIVEEAKSRLLARGVPALDGDVRVETRAVYQELADRFKTDIKLLA